MSRAAIALIIFSIVIGSSFYYWRGMPFFLIPMFAIGLNLVILAAIFPSIILQTKKSKSIWTKVSKWFFWIGSTIYMFLLAGYQAAWSSGILKFACMQDFTPEMKSQMDFSSQPLTMETCHLSMSIVVLNMVLFLLRLKYKEQTWEKLKSIFHFMKTHTVVSCLSIVFTLALAVPAAIIMEFVAAGCLVLLGYFVTLK